jgi:hypothetical protein
VCRVANGGGPEEIDVDSAPDTLTLGEHRDGGGSGAGRWVRRGGIALLAVVALSAVLNVFGQRPETSTLSTGAARLQVYAPSSARGGLVYAARFRVDARKEIKKAILVLEPGWTDQYTVNGVSPQPISEGSDNGKLLFNLGHIPRGEHYTLFLSLQINPTNVGQHGQDVWLYNGKKQIAVIHREITIWP